MAYTRHYWASRSGADTVRASPDGARPASRQTTGNLRPPPSGIASASDPSPPRARRARTQAPSAPATQRLSPAQIRPAPPLLHHPAPLVDNADRRLLQRHVQTSIVLYCLLHRLLPCGLGDSIRLSSEGHPAVPSPAPRLRQNNLTAPSSAIATFFRQQWRLSHSRCAPSCFLFGIAGERRLSR